VRAICFVDDDDHLTQVPTLCGVRSVSAASDLYRVDKQRAIDHVENTFDLAAVGVTRCINDVDFHIIQMTAVFFAESLYALASQGRSYQNTLARRITRAEDFGLQQHSIHQCGFSAIDMGNDGNIANIVASLCHVVLYEFYTSSF
jgi:hypothetical protein